MPAQANGWQFGPGDRRSGRGTHMREEQVRADVAAQIAEVLVRPGGAHLAIEARLGMISVPSETEPVAIGARGRLQGVNALRDQRMLRLRHIMFQSNRGPAIGDPSAHQSASVVRNASLDRDGPSLNHPTPACSCKNCSESRRNRPRTCFSVSMDPAMASRNNHERSVRFRTARTSARSAAASACGGGCDFHGVKVCGRAPSNVARPIRLQSCDVPIGGHHPGLRHKAKYIGVKIPVRPPSTSCAAP